jgi:hypothetical protein
MKMKVNRDIINGLAMHLELCLHNHATAMGWDKRDMPSDLMIADSIADWIKLQIDIDAHNMKLS